MRKAISVGAGKLVISLLSIYIWRIYSDHLSLAQIGIITLLINFDSLFGLVSASPFGNYMSATALADVRNQMLGKKVAGYFFLTLLLSGVSFFILLLYASALHLTISFSLLALFVLFIFLNNAIPIIPTLFTVVNKTELSMGLQVFKSAAAVISLLAVFFFNSSVSAWIFASVLGVLLPAIVNMYFLQKAFPVGKLFPIDLRGFISKETLLKFILPYAVMQLLMWFFFSAYRIYSGKLFDLEFLGKIGLLFSFSSQVCSAFDSVITQIYQADFYRLIDAPDQEKKLEKFGIFLKRVQPSYLLFLFLGFLPFVMAIHHVLQPSFQPDVTLLLSAWMFNFVRINMNLYGLITQVLFTPKVVSRFVLIGVVLSVGTFLLMFLFRTLATPSLFLVTTAAVPITVLTLLVFYISRLVRQHEIFITFLLNFTGCFSIITLLLSHQVFLLPDSNHNLLLYGLAGMFMTVIGIHLLTLQKKLKSIGN